MLGKTPRAGYLASKKLSTLLKKRLFSAEAIFISVISRPRNKSSLDMHDAAHTMMISDIATSAWLIDFCHKAI